MINVNKIWPALKNKSKKIFIQKDIFYYKCVWINIIIKYLGHISVNICSVYMICTYAQVACIIENETQ